MEKLLTRAALSLGALVLIALASSTARADIIVVAANNPQDDENVLLPGGTTANPIIGVTNQTQLNVRFLGTESLTVPASGQARITATDNSLRALTVDLQGGGTFSSLIFNLNAAADGTVTFTGVDNLGNVENLGTFDLDGGGENFFTFTTILNQRIRSISFTTNVDLLDVRQVRIGGAQAPAAIPEPATMILLGTGLAGVAVRARRRRKG